MPLVAETPISHGVSEGKRLAFPVGTSIPPELDDDGALSRCGAVRDDPEASEPEVLADLIAALDAAPPGAGQKPLARMNKGELLEIVGSEKVEVAGDATNAQLVAAIEEAREQRARSASGQAQE